MGNGLVLTGVLRSGRGKNRGRGLLHRVLIWLSHRAVGPGRRENQTSLSDRVERRGAASGRDGSRLSRPGYTSSYAPLDL